MASSSAESGFQELLGGVDTVLDCSPEALTPCSLAGRLAGKKLAIVYFSANWCGPCRRFTPLLKDWYAEMKDDVEVIFASCCDDADAFEVYAKKHSWVALPYDVSQGGLGYVRSAVREATGQSQGKLATMCGVSSVPTIGVFDVSTGALIAKNGRLDISTTDNGPDGEPPIASYASAASVVQKWLAGKHSWLTAGSAASGAMVVEPLQMAGVIGGEEAQAAAAKSELFLLLVASADAETGRSWCPDCVAVRPRLESLFGQLPAGAMVIEAPVSREEWKGNATHPYRHAPFNAGGVPCLLRLGPGGEVLGSLTEGELMSEQLDVFLGLAEDPADFIAGGSGESSVILSGLPANPAAAVAYQIKSQLDLVKTPFCRSLGAGRAVLEVTYAPDLATIKAAGAVHIFGAKVVLGSAASL